jgi:Phosphotransferase enzyme family
MMEQRLRRLLGSAVVASWPVDRGYTSALRRVVGLADGRTAFVKVATSPEIDGWLHDEWRVYSKLEAPFLPAVLGWDAGPPATLVLEDLSHAEWPPPWDKSRIDRVLATLATVASTPPPPGLGPVSDDALLTGWGRVIDGPAHFRSLGLASSRWIERCLPELRGAEVDAPMAGNALLHLDVRSDNLCFAGERTLLVDWNRAVLGNPAVDIAFWLPSLALEAGGRPEEYAKVDPRLAARAAGFFAARAGLPQIPSAPRVRSIQFELLRVALPWACRLLGLPPPDAMV